MTLLELLQLVRRHLALVIVLPVVCALLTAVYAWGFMPDEYTAETSIYAYSKTDNNVSGGTAVQSDLNASQMLANDFAELAANDQLQQETADTLGMESLDGFDIEVVSSTTTRVIKIDVTGGDPQAAALIANKLASQIGTTAKRVMDISAVNVVSKAEVPEKASGPRRSLYTLVALLAGLFLAIAIIVLRDMLNTTLRTDEECVELLGLPVIGRIPLAKGAKR